jgi:hypothetical protein
LPGACERADAQGACLQAADAYGKAKGISLLALATAWRTETKLMETRAAARLIGCRRGARKSAEDMATTRTHGSEETTGSEEDDVPRRCVLDG